MFRIIIILLIILLLLIIVFDITRLKKFNLIKKISNKYLRNIVATLPFIIIILLFNYVNSFVIFIHLAIFFGIASFIVWLIKKIFKKEFHFYLTGVIAVSLTIIYLGIGAYLDYHVFETRYSILTNKELGQETFRIIQISDSHVGTTFNGDGFKKHMEKISKIKSDIFVITGDFVDDDTTKDDMIKSCEALALIKPTYGKYFVFGNHDRGYFNHRNFSESDLISELNKNGVIVLNDEIEKINDYIYLVGRDDRTNPNRKSIKELTEGIADKYIIDLNHQPNDYKNEMNNVDLVLSGHTHGGQLFPLGYLGLIFGSNDEFDGLHVRENTSFVINSGISDWAIDFKTGTYSEYVIVDIKKDLL